VTQIVSMKLIMMHSFDLFWMICFHYRMLQTIHT